MMKKKHPQSTDAMEVVRIDLRTEMTQAKDKEPWEPLDKILWTAFELGDDQTLVLVAPFEPLLLIRILIAQGLDCESECNQDGDWEVRVRNETFSPANGQQNDKGGIIELDLRGVTEIPSLSVLTEALAQLPDSATELVVHSDHPLDTGELPDHCTCVSVSTAEESKGNFTTRIHLRNE